MNLEDLYVKKHVLQGQITDLVGNINNKIKIKNFPKEKTVTGRRGLTQTEKNDILRDISPNIKSSLMK